MSMPTFPQNDPPLTREGSLNEIISSIAAEELSLSHLLNVEGEKLQYVLGTMPGLDGAASLDEVMQVNKSVKDTLAVSISLIEPVPPKLTLCLCGACADAFRGTGAFALREAVPGQAEKEVCAYCKKQAGEYYDVLPLTGRRTV